MAQRNAMRKLATASGLFLALPLSASSFLTEDDLFGETDGYESTIASRADVSPLGAVWSAYLELELTPDYSWAPSDSSLGFDDGLLARAGFGDGPLTPHVPLWSDAGGRLSLSLRESGASPVAGATSGSVLEFIRPSLSHGLHRTVVAPSLSQPLTDSSSISVSAVFAFQRFASMGMGAVQLNSSDDVYALRSPESSFGTGLRFALDSEINNWARWELAYQSRVDMDAFRNYRGLFSEPGKFDIPASGKARLNLDLSDSVTLGMGAQRVMYSDVAPFTTLALPDRFLALLGDGASPEFAWRDLTVYSLSLGWLATERDYIEFRYTTRQQPEPTSQRLTDALSPEFTDQNLALGWTHDAGSRGTFSFAATYAASEYFLGDLAFRSAEISNGDQVELEAVWSLSF